jgi:hypothetical protein
MKAREKRRRRKERKARQRARYSPGFAICCEILWDKLMFADLPKDAP